MRGFSGLAGAVSFLLVAGTIAVPAADAGTARAGATAQPTDLYVNAGSSSCNNSGSGTQATPFCTIQAAANVVNPGQTVYIVTQPGGPSYYESVTIKRSGTSSAPITFARLGQEPIPDITPTTQSVPLTLQGVHDVNFYSVGVSHYYNENGIDVVGSRDITLDRMFIGQEGLFSAVSAGIAIDGASSEVTVSRAEINGDYGYGIQVQPGATGVTATTNDIGMSGGTGISVQGATTAAVTSNSVYMECGTDVSMTGGSAAVAENNVLNASWSSTASCPAGGAALAADSSSARTSRADYNGLYAQAPSTEYSWAGTAYSRAADFSAITGQGTHDLDLTWQQTVTHPPAEGSPIIDSADCAAPGELTTDILGNPHVADPEVTDTGNGTCHADRGAYERQDAVGTSFTVTPSSGQGAAPLNVGVTLTSSPTSQWGEPVSYTVDFGDGGGPQPVAPDGTVTHTYTTPGVYTLTVTAADTGGSTGSSHRQIIVGTETAPTVTLGAGPDILNGLGVPSISTGAASFTISAGADAWELASGTISFGDGTSKAMGTDLNWTHLYPHPGTYTATLTETDLLGRLSTASAKVTVGDEFIPIGPYQDYSHSVPAHGTVRLSMAALNAGASDTRAAYVTITVTGPKKAGSVTVYPNGSAIPKEAAVQFSAGHAASNTALAVPGGQTVDFYNGSGGSINLAVDTYGVEVTATPGIGGTNGDTYAPDGPVRLLPATKVAAGGHVTLTVAGTHGIPAKADAVVLDVTASGTKAAGYLSAYPDRTADPGIHAADWAAGQMVTGLATVPLQDGKVVLRNGSKGSAVFTADVVGYFNYYGTGSVFLPSAPLRLLDVKIGPRRTTTLRISGKDGLPGSGISAAAVNLTAGGAAAGGYIVGWADKAARPSATSLTYSAGASAAAAGIIPVGADGVIDLYNGGSSTVSLIVDLTGAYYLYP